MLSYVVIGSRAITKTYITKHRHFLPSRWGQKTVSNICQPQGAVASWVGIGDVHDALTQAVGVRARIEERDRDPATRRQR